jgi:hypothetical protein
VRSARRASEECRVITGGAATPRISSRNALGLSPVSANTLGSCGSDRRRQPSPQGGRAHPTSLLGVWVSARRRRGTEGRWSALRPKPRAVTHRRRSRRAGTPGSDVTPCQDRLRARAAVGSSRGEVEREPERRRTSRQPPAPATLRRSPAGGVELPPDADSRSSPGRRPAARLRRRGALRLGDAGPVGALAGRLARSRPGAGSAR